MDGSSCGLNVKCPSPAKAHVFEHLVTSCWHSLSERPVEPLRGGALMEEVDTKGGLCGLIAWSYFLLILCFLSVGAT